MIILNMHTVGRSFFRLSAAGRQTSPRTTTPSGRCLGTTHSIEYISREVRGCRGVAHRRCMPRQPQRWAQCSARSWLHPTTAEPARRSRPWNRCSEPPSSGTRWGGRAGVGGCLEARQATTRDRAESKVARHFVCFVQKSVVHHATEREYFVHIYLAGCSFQPFQWHCDLLLRRLM